MVYKCQPGEPVPEGEGKHKDAGDTDDWYDYGIKWHPLGADDDGMRKEDGVHTSQVPQSHF